jgi:hypothetical protein
VPDSVAAVGLVNARLALPVITIVPLRPVSMRRNVTGTGDWVSGPPSTSRCLAARSDAELSVELLVVPANCFGGEVESRGNRAVTQPLGEEPQDVELTVLEVDPGYHGGEGKRIVDVRAIPCDIRHTLGRIILNRSLLLP